MVVVFQKNIYNQNDELDLYVCLNGSRDSGCHSFREEVYIRHPANVQRSVRPRSSSTLSRRDCDVH